MIHASGVYKLQSRAGCSLLSRKPDTVESYAQSMISSLGEPRFVYEFVLETIFFDGLIYERPVVMTLGLYECLWCSSHLALYLMHICEHACGPQALITAFWKPSGTCQHSVLSQLAASFMLSHDTQSMAPAVT